MTEITKWDFFKNPTTFCLQETHLKQKEDNMIKSKRLGGKGTNRLRSARQIK